MSVENLKEYARRCASEPELAAEAKSIGITDIDRQMEYAGSLGLEWNLEDMETFKREVADAEGEISGISDEDLEKVAGGLVTVTGAIVAGVVVTGVAAGAAAGAGVAAAGVAVTGQANW